MTTKIPAEQAKFIENWAGKLNIKIEPLGSIEEWYYMPFYLKKTGENMFDVVSFEHLPQHVVDFIKSERNTITYKEPAPEQYSSPESQSTATKPEH